MPNKIAKDPRIDKRIKDAFGEIDFDSVLDSRFGHEHVRLLVQRQDRPENGPRPPGDRTERPGALPDRRGAGIAVAPADAQSLRNRI